jgi:hypothetical protein
VKITLFLTTCLSLALPNATWAQTGATVDVVKTDLSTHTVTIRLRNNSTKDITAYAVSLETVYADSSSSFSEHDEDLGPRAVAQHTTIAPGQRATPSRPATKKGSRLLAWQLKWFHSSTRTRPGREIRNLLIVW